jgi:hypothetical protein
VALNTREHAANNGVTKCQWALERRRRSDPRNASLTTKGDLPVPNYPLIRSLRAEDLAGNYEPMHCDYPVALMTRRTFALSADRILQSRAIAPSSLDGGQSFRWASRPPC